MSIKKLLSKLDDFFDQSKNKQKKKYDKLVKIILSLEEKKSDLKQEMKIESKKNKKSKAVYNLCKEYKVITKMIKKAKKQEYIISRDEDI